MSITKMFEFEAYSLTKDDHSTIIEVSFEVLSWNEVDEFYLWSIDFDRPVSLLELSRPDGERLKRKALDIAHDSQAELAEARSEGEDSGYE